VSTSERVGTTLTSGAGSTVPPDSVFKPNEIYLKRIQICPNINRSKMCLFFLQKFQIKYVWKELVLGNNIYYRNFSRFEMEFELKIRELL
jgi:hypothetical protein